MAQGRSLTRAAPTHHPLCKSLPSRDRQGAIMNTTFVTSICFAFLTGCARHYRGEGIVLAIHPPEVTISHRAIPRYMPAMAMAFRAARPASLSTLQPGARVEFDLKVRGSESELVRIREQTPAPPGFEVPKPRDVVAISQLV